MEIPYPGFNSRQSLDISVTIARTGHKNYPGLLQARTGNVQNLSPYPLQALHNNTNQTRGPASYAEGPEVQISSLAGLKFTMDSSFPSNANMAPKIRPASLVYTPSKSSVINYPTIRCYIELLAASL